MSSDNSQDKETRELLEYIDGLMTDEQRVDAGLYVLILDMMGLSDNEKVAQVVNYVLTAEQRALVYAQVEVMIGARGKGGEKGATNTSDLSVPGGQPGDTYTEVCRSCPGFKGGFLESACNPEMRRRKRAQVAAQKAEPENIDPLLG